MAKRIKRFFVFLFFSLFFSMNSGKESQQTQSSATKMKNTVGFSFNSAFAKCKLPPPNPDPTCKPGDPYCSPASF